MQWIKSGCLLGVMLLCLQSLSAQQDTTRQNKRQLTAYTFFVNVVPDNFKLPLIGFVNLARGNHATLQLGFVNTTLKNFNGSQIGFVNPVLGNFNGLQTGFVNFTKGRHQGFQLGFVNATLKDFAGPQIGFINNSFGKTDGAQIGFVNFTRKQLTGVQLGFINVVDSVTTGVPIGFLSFVRKGGYQAVEVSASELYPINFAFKTGIRQFYSILKASYYPELNAPFALGLGFGALLPVGKNTYFSPEVESLTPVTRNSWGQQIISLSGKVQYSINEHFHCAIGPSLVWQRNSSDNELNDPYFALYRDELNGSHRLLVGLRAGVSYSFSKFPSVE